MSNIAALVADNLDIWTGAIERKSGAGRGGGKRINLYGIERLRALILDLAVRGKLVPQDAGDEPAIQLLKQIEKKKAAQVPPRKRRQVQVKADGTPTAPIMLPSGWEIVTLSQLATIHRGVTYSKSEASDIDSPGLIGLLRGHNIQSEINLENLVYVPRSVVSDDQILAAGDIVIAMSSGSSDLVGKAAQYGELSEVSFGAFCGVIRPSIEPIQPFLAFFCRTPFYRNQTQKGGKGIGIQNLSKGDLESLLCPLPPLAEQQRIVAKVDELMALCDALEQESADALAAHQALVEILLSTLVNSADAADLATNWARLESHFDTLFTTEASIEALKQTILDLAVRGKLVEQDAGDEPASELIKRIAQAQATGSYKKRTTAKSGKSSISKNIPRGWKEVQVGDIFSIRTGFAFKSSTYATEGTLVFRVTNFNRDGTFDLTDSVYFPTDQINEKLAGFLLEKEDIIMVMVGGTIGKTTIIDNSILPALLNQNMWRIRSYGKHIFSRYEYLLVKILNSKIEGLTQSTHGHFAMGDFTKRTLLIPPLAEQHRIVAKVDELMAMCDQLKTRLADAAQTQRHLADAIVERAAA